MQPHAVPPSAVSPTCLILSLPRESQVPRDSQGHVSGGSSARFVPRMTLTWTGEGNPNNSPES